MYKLLLPLWGLLFLYHLGLVSCKKEEKEPGGNTGTDTIRRFVYWEPAWISSSMKDLYGTGSAWENVTLFDFNGAVLPGIGYMKYSYK